MRLDHLLASDPLNRVLTDAQHAEAREVLETYGFCKTAGRLTIGDTVKWMTVEAQDGVLRVHVESPMPEHVLETIRNVCDALVQVAGLVRIDPLRLREISALEWTQRIADESRTAYRRRGL